ncbi:MAG: urea ABC transporter permease subunit UrtC, partial [Pelagibacterales bacterium]|nr:urea ABC transporter permease subunit UrtC [Pelagibacterales bacterium]
MISNFIILNILRGDIRTKVFLSILLFVAIIVPLLNIYVPASSYFHLTDYHISLFGKYLTYGLLALSLDLIWGYCGILSLGHGAFFALGGYCIGIHFMREIGPRGVYGDPILPDFMVFLNWSDLPLAWYGFDSFS